MPPSAFVARQQDSERKVDRRLAASLALICAWGAAGCASSPGLKAATPTAGDEDAPAGPVVPTSEPSAVFTLAGRPFCFAGTSNYYLTYKSPRMVDDLLGTAKAMGLKVVRIWAYLDRGSLDGTVRNVDGPGAKDGVYFHYWDPARQRPAFNDGASGLEHLDYVLARAQALGLKVVLVLSNNWKEFGGMDQYLVWYGLGAHHQFFTDEAVAQAYQAWAAHLIERRNVFSGLRYRDDPTIFAWELANEPRCTNAGELGAGAGCDASMLSAWVERMSAYIKSLDPNHLVSVGDEGFFAQGSDPGYDGAEGVDHRAFLAARHVDFGTFHLYPEAWGHPLRWGTRWIDDHIAAARSAGKPTLLEEYGVVAQRDANGAITDDSRRRRAYTHWHDLVARHGGDAGLFWMLAGKDDGADAQRGMYPDYDHLQIYARDLAAGLIRDFAATMSADARACDLYAKLAPGRIPASVFVGTAPPPGALARASAAREDELTRDRRAAHRPPPRPLPRYSANADEAPDSPGAQ